MLFKITRVMLLSLFLSSALCADEEKSIVAFEIGGKNKFRSDKVPTDGFYEIETQTLYTAWIDVTLYPDSYAINFKYERTTDDTAIDYELKVPFLKYFSISHKNTKLNQTIKGTAQDYYGNDLYEVTAVIGGGNRDGSINSQDVTLLQNGDEIDSSTETKSFKLQYNIFGNNKTSPYLFYAKESIKGVISDPIINNMYVAKYDDDLYVDILFKDTEVDMDWIGVGFEFNVEPTKENIKGAKGFIEFSYLKGVDKFNLTDTLSAEERAGGESSDTSGIRLDADFRMYNRYDNFDFIYGLTSLLSSTTLKVQSPQGLKKYTSSYSHWGLYIGASF